MNRRKRDHIIAWLFLFPATFAFVVFMFWPLAYTVYLSFLKWNMVAPTKKFVGFKNYASIVQDEVTIQIVANTLFYIAILVILIFAIPYILSYVNTFVMKKGKSIYKTLLFIPSLISLVVGAIVLQWIFNPISGPVSGIMGKFGITMPTWSKTKGLVIFVIALVAVLKSFGYNFLVLLSGMQYVFTPIKVLTQGGPNNASSNIIYGVYQEAFTFYNTGKASALSIMTMVIFLILLYLEFKYVEKGVYYEN